MVSAVDGEARGPWSEPCDAVLSITGIVDGRRSAGRGKEAKLVQCDAIEGGKENLAESAVGKRVPELALRPRPRAQCHLATRPPPRRCARASWCLHRGVSMRRGRGG